MQGVIICILVYMRYANIIWSGMSLFIRALINSSSSLDLTTYDTAKQFLLRHTDLEDTSITHMLSRWAIVHV